MKALGQYNEFITQWNKDVYDFDPAGYAVACVGTQRVRYLKQVGEKSNIGARCSDPIIEWTTKEEEVTAFTPSTASRIMASDQFAVLWPYMRLVIVPSNRENKPPMRLPTVNGF